MEFIDEFRDKKTDKIMEIWQCLDCRDKFTIEQFTEMPKCRCYGESEGLME